MDIAYLKIMSASSIINQRAKGSCRSRWWRCTMEKLRKFDFILTNLNLENIIFLYFRMPGEELFELNIKINQIRNNIDKRKEKVVEWNVPYQKILTVSRTIYRINLIKPDTFRNSTTPSKDHNLMKQAINLRTRLWIQEKKLINIIMSWKNLISCWRRKI